MSAKAGLLLSLLPFLGACDVGVGVALLVRTSDDSDGSPAAASTVPQVDTSYHVWIATVADPVAEHADLVSRAGRPNPAVWTEVGTATRSALFDPSAAATSFNAILLQATDAVIYHFDAIEVLEAVRHHVVATAAAPVYSNLVLTPAAIVGTPDGLPADTAATPTERAFLFATFTAPLERFRVNAWAAARGPGDVEWVATWADAGNESAGGAGVTSAGAVVAAVSDAAGGNRDIRLLRIDAAGALLAPVTVSAGVSAAEGSASVAVHPTDDTVYVAATIGGGNIQVSRYLASLASTVWSVTFDSGLGVDRAEANAIAVNASGDAVVAGGAATLANGIDPWMRRFGAAAGGTIWTQTPPPLPVDTADTGWHAAAFGSAGELYASGDLTSTASGFIEVVTRRSNPGTGAAIWSDQFGDNTAPADLGRAVASDASGNVYCGGFMGTSTQGRNGALLKYLPGGFLTSFITFDDLNAMDDEILDLAVEPDGTVYAVGYEAVAGQGQNLWIRKYDPAGSAVWTRTYDGGAGDDRGAAVVITGTSVIVVGSRTEAGGETNIHVRRYAR